MSPVRHDNTNCPRCDQFARFGLAQVFGFRWSAEEYANPGPYYFDVAAARAVVGDGRAPRYDVRENVGRALAQTSVFPDHFPHVDMRLIPIVAKVRLKYLRRPDEYVTGMPFIDGKHVAARWLVRGADRVRFFVLSEAETERILIPDVTVWAAERGLLDMVEEAILIHGVQ